MQRQWALIWIVFVSLNLVVIFSSASWGAFVDNGDGTVTDTVTGLMWQQGDGHNDSGRRTWQEALSYCEGCTEAGYRDWRLPNIRELESIGDWSTYSPAIDPVFDCRSSGYWSSSTYAPDPGLAWHVYFDDGGVDHRYGKDSGYYVRCVRGGPGGSKVSSTYNYGNTSNSGYSDEPVNTALGNYIHEHTDLSISSRGLPIEFTRTYNSQDSYQGPLGSGWNHSYNIFLYSPEPNATVVKYGDGHEEPYIDNGNGTFTPKHGGFYNTLVQNADDTYTLTNKKQTKYHFSENGTLTSIVDKNGNTIILDYTEGNLVTITGPAGRTLDLTYESNNRLTQVQDPIGRTLSYEYDAEGNLISYTDPRGNTWNYSYDGQHQMTNVEDTKGNLTINEYEDGKVVSQTDPRANITRFQYDTPNEGETTIVDPTGNSTIHTYDANYQLIKETDPLGNTRLYNYDDNFNRIEVKDKNSNITLYAYDDMGNVVKKINSQGNATTITYNENNNPVNKTDALGNTITYDYDENDNLITKTDPLGNEVTFTYNTYGQMITKTDKNGHTTTYSYDDQGNLVQKENALGNITTYTYDSVGRKLSQTDANDHTTTFTYDENDNLLSTTDPNGDSVAYTYDANGNKITKTDKKGNTYQYSYNENGNLISKTDPLGNITRYTYDALDRKISMTDARGNTTTYSYDATGNLVRIEDPLGNITTHSYDPNGNRIATTDPLGQITSFIYDSLNQKTSTTDPLSNTASKTYDALGRVVSSTDKKGNSKQYKYDDLGRLTQVTEPNGEITRYSYDKVGNRISITNARGKTTNFEYDDVNRLTQRTDPAGNTVSYQYDAVGNRIQVNKPDGSVIAYDYDALNRLVEISYPSESSVTYQYDANGNRIQMSDSLGTSTWSFDALDRMVSYTDPFGKEIQYSYDANSNRSELTYPGGRTVQYDYDAAKRLVSVTDWRGNVTTYAYDAAGNLISRDYPNETNSEYEYDQASRLVGLTNYNPESEVINSYRWSLDEAGNPESVNRNEPIAPLFESMNATYTYGDDNRIKSSGETTFTHDANGNRIKEENGQTINYTYNSEDQLTEISGNKDIQYAYDGLGNRLKKIDGGEETSYVLDINRRNPYVIAKTDSSGNAQSYYVYGLGLLYKLTPDGSLYAYHYDQRGSTIAISDSIGDIRNKYAYSPFGRIISSSEQIDNPFGFVGRYGIMEEVEGLKYMRARYYHAKTGRFLQKDPAKGNIKNPQELNRYIYALNNPIVKIDLSGLIAEDTKNSLINSGNYHSDILHKKLFETNKLNLSDDTDQNIAYSIEEGIIDTGKIVLDVGSNALSMTKISSAGIAIDICLNSIEELNRQGVSWSSLTNGDLSLLSFRDWAESISKGYYTGQAVAWNTVTEPISAALRLVTKGRMDVSVTGDQLYDFAHN